MQQELVRARLLALAEPSYQRFAARLLPGVNNLLGIRLPKLRMLAKEIAKGDWRGYLATAKNDYFEDVMLQGMLIGLVELESKAKLKLAQSFIPQIDNWSVCDSFCSGFKVARQEPELVWQFIQPYLQSTKVYELRFAVVILINYYIDQRYINDVLKKLIVINKPDYYVEMAVAWAIATCYAKFPQITLPYLQAKKLPIGTAKKALQKILESLQVDEYNKEVIKQMRHDNKEADNADNLTIVYETAIAKLGVVTNGDAVIKLLFNHLSTVNPCRETSLHRLAISEIHEYLAGNITEFTVPIKLSGTPFQQSVWQALRKIPYGETRCYKDIAAFIGNPSACRAVGMANNRNPLPIIIPCHRVIGFNGKLVGYAGGIKIKEYLLNIEQSGKHKTI